MISPSTTPTKGTPVFVFIFFNQKEGWCHEITLTNSNDFWKYCNPLIIELGFNTCAEAFSRAELMMNENGWIQKTINPPTEIDSWKLEIMVDIHRCDHCLKKLRVGSTAYRRHTEYICIPCSRD